MLRFVLSKAGRELDKDPQREALDLKEKLTEEINQKIRDALTESSYKMLETLKQMKVKAQKSVEKVETIKGAFLETVRTALAGTLVDLTAHASVFDNDI